ncbi:MAG: phage tail assembly protein [Armatimonadota bacterium]
MNTEAVNTNADESEEISFSGSYEFAKPVTFEGVKYDQVSYDLDALKSGDVISCKKEAAKIRGSQGESLLTDDILCAIIFARSADLPAGIILELSAADYAAWVMVGQGFFATSLSGLKR